MPAKVKSVPPLPIVTDLIQIADSMREKENENQAFRVFLKSENYSERRLRKLGAEIEAKIDCKKCANCCRVCTIGITDRDVGRLAKFLGVTREEFVGTFTEHDEPNDRGKLILKRTAEGCVFLKDNLCTVYPARPSVCADFPHLTKRRDPIANSTLTILAHAEICPIVYNWLEWAKVETGADAEHLRNLWKYLQDIDAV